jgi:hypothetical protein
MARQERGPWLPDGQGRARRLARVQVARIVARDPVTTLATRIVAGLENLTACPQCAPTATVPHLPDAQKRRNQAANNKPSNGLEPLVRT